MVPKRVCTASLVRGKHPSRLPSRTSHHQMASVSGLRSRPCCRTIHFRTLIGVPPNGRPRASRSIQALRRHTLLWPALEHLNTQSLNVSTATRSCKHSSALFHFSGICLSLLAMRKVLRISDCRRLRSGAAGLPALKSVCDRRHDAPALQLHLVNL